MFTAGVFAFRLPAHCSSESEWASTLPPGRNERCQLQPGLLRAGPGEPWAAAAARDCSYCLPVFGVGWKWENNFDKVISWTGKNHYQHPSFAKRITSALVMSQRNHDEALVLNRYSFNALCNEKGEEQQGRVTCGKKNRQLSSHLITPVVIYLPRHQQTNDPHHQHNH